MDGDIQAPSLQTLDRQTLQPDDVPVPIGAMKFPRAGHPGTRVHEPAVGGQAFLGDPRPQFHRGQQPARRGAHRSILLMDHVQDHAIIGRIMLVPMGVPFTGPNMHLHRTRPFLARYPDAGIDQVRPSMVLDASRTEHLHRPAICGAQVPAIEQLLLPDELEQVLGIRERGSTLPGPVGPGPVTDQEGSRYPAPGILQGICRKQPSGRWGHAPRQHFRQPHPQKISHHALHPHRRLHGLLQLQGGPPGGR